MGCENNSKCYKVSKPLFTALLIVSIISMAISFYTWNFVDNSIIKTGKVLDENVENYVYGVSRQYVKPRK